MIDPSINALMTHVDSKFTLAILASKRARQLMDGAPKLSNCNSQKSVTIAINEINENKISYINNKTGTK